MPDSTDKQADDDGSARHSAQHREGAHAPGPGTPAAETRSSHAAKGSHAKDNDDDGGKGSGGGGNWGWLREILVIIAVALILSFLIKTFLFRAFFIPSGSMENTLRIDDRIFVNLLAKETGDIERGDVVVFEDNMGWLPPVVQQPDGPANWFNEALTFVGLIPDSSQQHLVKRVIGVGGDHVVCCNAEGQITINGEPIEEPYLYPGAAPSDSEFDVKVPEGKIWVMGDHRNASSDSREHHRTDGNGFVDVDAVEGEAVVIAWPLSHFDFLGSYPEVFDNIPEPDSSAQSLTRPEPVGAE